MLSGGEHVDAGPGERDGQLPALPAAWPNGAVRGLRARGGLQVDVSGQVGRLERAVLRAAVPATVQVCWAAGKQRVDLAAGETHTIKADQ